MGVSTNADICFGIWFGEDVEFPWDEYSDSIYSWWREVNGWESIYDTDGEYKNGIKPTEKEIRDYYDKQREFDTQFPLLVELVNAQSTSYPAYILALKSTIITAHRGYPVQISRDNLVVPFDEITLLQQFCAKYGIEYEGEPAWYLSSFWEE